MPSALESLSYRLCVEDAIRTDRSIRNISIGLWGLGAIFAEILSGDAIALEADGPENSGGFGVGDGAFGLEERGVTEGPAEIGSVAILMIGVQRTQGNGIDFVEILEGPGFADIAYGRWRKGCAGVEGHFPAEDVFAGDGFVGVEAIAACAVG